MNATDAAFSVALALVVAGVAFIYWPAAFIVAGALVAAFTVALARGEDDPSEDGK